MKSRVLFFLVLIALTTTLAQAQPVIRTTNGVLNASSYLPGVARGTWFVVFGTGLGPATISMQTSLPYPPVLSGTSVTFTPAGGDACQRADVLHAGGPVAWVAAVRHTGRRLQRHRDLQQPDQQCCVYQCGGSQLRVCHRDLQRPGPCASHLRRVRSQPLYHWHGRPMEPAARTSGRGHGALGNRDRTGRGPPDITGGSSGDQTGSASVSVIVSGVAVTPAYAGRSQDRRDWTKSISRSPPT